MNRKTTLIGLCLAFALGLTGCSGAQSEVVETVDEPPAEPDVSLPSEPCLEWVPLRVVVTFSRDQADLDDNARRLLEGFAVDIRPRLGDDLEAPRLRVRGLAHGGESDAEALALRRAESVRDFLVDYEIPAGLLEAVGETDPSSGDDATAYDLQRVTFSIALDQPPNHCTEL